MVTKRLLIGFQVPGLGILLQICTVVAPGEVKLFNLEKNVKVQDVLSVI